MLVLSRKKKEEIVIGRDIVVTVIEVRGDKVRLGIEAPKDVAVHRREVYEAIQQQNREESQLGPKDARQIERPHQPPRREPRSGCPEPAADVQQQGARGTRHQMRWTDESPGTDNVRQGAEPRDPRHQIGWSDESPPGHELHRDSIRPD